MRNISTQQIQAVVRTYNKQLRLSGINKSDKKLPNPRVKNRVDRGQADSKQHHSKQRHHKNSRSQ
jgi:hypothetical protein